MPLSHISLTVAHLPTSCSFFLSCLQPLGYKYVGQEVNSIGFGVNDPDFFIVQESPGVPAGAAHIAFPAPSRAAVDEFFHAALKAGGTFHGEPRLRDSFPEYYSAAVIDFDGNSIEAVYKSPTGEVGRSIAPQSVIGSTTWNAAPSVAVSATPSLAKSTTSKAKDNSGMTKDLLDEARNAAHLAKSIAELALPTAIIPTVQSHQQCLSNDNSNSKTLVGTLLGAAAGAFVAYQMTKTDSSPSPPQPPVYRSLTYPPPLSTTSNSAPDMSPYMVRAPLAIEAANSTYSQPRQPYCEPAYSMVEEVEYIPASVVGSRASKASMRVKEEAEPESVYLPASVVGSRASKPRSIYHRSHPEQLAIQPKPASTIVGTFIPPTEIPLNPHLPHSTTRVSEVTIRHKSRTTSSSKPPSVAPSRTPSSTHTKASKVPSATAVPLPASIAGSAKYEGSLVDLGSVAPCDSISQVSSRPPSHRSKTSAATRTLSKIDEPLTPDDSISMVGSAASTVKPKKAKSRAGSRHSRDGSKHGSKDGSRERSKTGRSTVSLPVRRGSDIGSVKSRGVQSVLEGLGIK